MPEVVREGVSGYVGNSVEELIGRARNLKFDPEKVRGYVEENFSVEAMAGKYLELYKEVLNGKKNSEREIQPRAVA